MYGRDQYFALGGSRGIGYGDYVADEQVYREYFAKKVISLGRSLPSGRLFEIGAAAGFFLDEARDWGWHVSGIEPSPDAAEYARRTLGLDVRTAWVEELEPQIGCFDAIAIMQTLEHIRDPLHALTWIRRALRPGGVVLITTPDVRSRTSRLMGPLWLSYRPEHLWYFDRRTLPYLLERVGLQPLSVRQDDALRVPVARIVERAGHYLGLSLHFIVERMSVRPRIPVELGDLEIIAGRTDDMGNQR